MPPTYGHTDHRATELLEERERTIAAARSIIDDPSRDPSEADAPLRRVDEIDRELRSREIEESPLGRPQPDDGWERRTGEPLSSEERTALRSYLADGETRALQTSTDPAGGYVVPEGFRDRVVETMQAFSGVRRFAEILPTETGEDLAIPTSDDTANEGEIVGEGGTATEQDVEFGRKVLKSFLFSSKLVKVSIQLLQDNQVNLEERLARWLGRRIARIQNRTMTTGTGLGEPEGIVANATVGQTAASATAIAYDDLVGLLHSVDPAYREAGGVGWMFNDTTLEELRKIKDANNNPIFQPGMERRAPDRLLGYPFVVNPDMDGIASGNRSVIFGSVRSGYIVRDVRSFALLRLAEKYATSFEVGFLGFQRSDGRIVDPDAFKVLEH